MSYLSNTDFVGRAALGHIISHRHAWWTASSLPTYIWLVITDEILQSHSAIANLDNVYHQNNYWQHVIFRIHLSQCLHFWLSQIKGTTSGGLGNFSHVLLVRHRLRQKGSLGPHNITPPRLVDCVKFTDLYMASYYWWDITTPQCDCKFGQCLSLFCVLCQAWSRAFQN